LPRSKAAGKSVRLPTSATPNKSALEWSLWRLPARLVQIIRDNPRILQAVIEDEAGELLYDLQHAYSADVSNLITYLASQKDADLAEVSKLAESLWRRADDDVPEEPCEICARQQTLCQSCRQWQEEMELRRNAMFGTLLLGANTIEAELQRENGGLSHRSPKREKKREKKKKDLEKLENWVLYRRKHRTLMGLHNDIEAMTPDIRIREIGTKKIPSLSKLKKVSANLNVRTRRASQKPVR
jgi:hypothetical protein